MPAADKKIEIALSLQRLRLYEDGRTAMDVAVSTAKNGPGERYGSECTPRGVHVVRAKIGMGSPSGAVFVGRRPTGELYSSELGARYPGRDWILTRILWLSGVEPGRNRLGKVDTMRRYIYIHGTPEHVTLGIPGSRGCVRMRNRDVIDLFERVPAGTRVEIIE
jgi:lipoprotein-anchoring transpeptidase ErfK/SrfK